MKKIVVVSLCDGISIGRYALEQLGYEVDYYRAEIKETANRVAITQFSDSHNLGDVTKVSYNDGVLHSELGDYQLDHIDMVIFGSPCQNFSRAMHTEDRMGLEGSKSSLFYECLRILQECNPDFYFMENVIMKNTIGLVLMSIIELVVVEEKLLRKTLMGTKDIFLMELDI